MRDYVGASNATAWLDLFTLDQLDTAAQPVQAVIAPKPNASHARRFATAPRLERLGVRLGELLDAPVRVSVQAQAKTPAAATPTADPSAPADSPTNGIDRREALNLPLVRDALEVFPDAILLDARKEVSEAANEHN